MLYQVNNRDLIVTASLTQLLNSNSFYTRLLIIMSKMLLWRHVVLLTVSVYSNKEISKKLIRPPVCLLLRLQRQ